MSRAVPFHKRFPGRHAVSATVVYPGGAKLEIDGPYPGEVAELVFSLLVSDTNGEPAQRLIAQLRLELERVAAAAPAAEPEAARV